jgi:hypothetical protein
MATICAFVGGVGEHLLITGHRCVETDLATGHAAGAEARAVVNRAIFKSQQCFHPVRVRAVRSAPALESSRGRRVDSGGRAARQSFAFDRVCTGWVGCVLNAELDSRSMFATIRKHQKWLWMIVIVLVIIAFVVLMDPTYSVTGGRIGGEGGSFGTINSRPIPREELLDTYAEVRLRYRLLTDQWPEEDKPAECGLIPSGWFRSACCCWRSCASSTSRSMTPLSPTGSQRSFAIVNREPSTSRPTGSSFESRSRVEAHRRGSETVCPS